MSGQTEDKLRALRDANESWLMAQPGVIGTGIGIDESGRLVIRVYVQEVSELTRQAIRARLAEATVDFQQGDITAY
jgi:hypothetical protein